MRLSEPDFESLLMHPVIETVSIDEVKEMIEKLSLEGPKVVLGGPEVSYDPEHFLNTTNSLPYLILSLLFIFDM